MLFNSKFLKTKISEGTYLAFSLTQNSREEILSLVTPKFKRILCDHIILGYGRLTEKLKEDYKGASLKIVGYQYGGNFDCLVVEVNHSIVRPDGEIFHITLSEKKRHKPSESNELLKQQGYNSLIPFSIEGDLVELPNI